MILRDYSILFAVIMIIVMMVIPLPTWMLDILIIINISLALTILLVAMNTNESLQFSIFPALLLLTTLFRLGLNVSTTRAILTGADAGTVIQTFGEFVVGGSVIVGFLVFLILVIIQFIVITKGSERVAEVAARFTLDAMPGKQMSIDADLNAGLINEQQARERREKIEKEADFYGAMDGAAKFVKGDAIAAIVITIINILGGLLIGMMVMGMPLNEAASTYTLLSIGDGLVSQIPALLLSTATGIVVTRVASDGNLSLDISRQVFAYPKLLYVVGGTIALLGILTPINPFLTLSIAGFISFGGFKMEQALKEQQEQQDVQEEEQALEEVKGPESVLPLLEVDPIEFEFGYSLIPLADANQGGDLLDRVVMIRRQCALELGMIVPVIRIRDNIQLKPNEYVIKIRGNRVAQGELLLDHYLAMSPGVEDESIEGIETVEPAFGLPALWITEEMKERAEMAGYTVVDPPSVVSTHLTEVIKRHAHELLGRQEVKTLLDHVKESAPAVVEELIPDLLTVGDVQKVLRNLLQERVSIRNLPLILESLADHASHTKDPDLLTEYVRQSLARQITHQYAGDNGSLKVITAGASLEKRIADAIQQTEQGPYLALDPETTQQIYQAVLEEVKRVQQVGAEPVLLTSPMIRMHLRRLLARYLPDLPVLSYNELDADIEVQSVGVVNV
ncbi:flagellar biosynthesis protein FlhA [Caldalkalibacillus thermarum]|uniref:flagellar biosynthesis protein FlhA n=1 Tax=Caldalkalibacillus thermarum TaxID=296745 RepID=UPI001665A620|nr:flagellar biosynthesis protein FlhA [Caldalkalibacillus thermarum]GGK13626.1 flagellar biosynthesis protein FlhA [Caldalkalibacillus thermarum]